VSTYTCPRCQYPDAPKGTCTLCGGARLVAWTAGPQCSNPRRTAGGVMTHVEQHRIETEAAKAVRS
jgi:hypothetical protein